MTDENIQSIIDMNYRALTLLGIATSMIIDCKKVLSPYDSYRIKCDWFIDAIQAVVYENKPLPKMPEE